jgi:hypothetical protein
MTPVLARVRLRRATKQDVAALVHLRSLMFSSMGAIVGGQDAAWRLAATRWFLEQLARLYQLAGFRERAFPSMRLLMQQPPHS